MVWFCVLLELKLDLFEKKNTTQPWGWRFVRLVRHFFILLADGEVAKQKKRKRDGEDIAGGSQNCLKRCTNFTMELKRSRRGQKVFVEMSPRQAKVWLGSCALQRCHTPCVVWDRFSNYVVNALQFKSDYQVSL